MIVYNYIVLLVIPIEIPVNIWIKSKHGYTFEYMKRTPVPVQFEYVAMFTLY